MKPPISLSVVAAAAMISTGLAAPPTCKRVQRNGTNFEVCERRDASCLAAFNPIGDPRDISLAEEEQKNPSKEWMGCWRRANIVSGHFTASGVTVFKTFITAFPSYGDSERMDITVTFERPYCGSRTHVRKEIPIVIHDDVASATIDINCLEELSGVPTIDALEKGGKKEALHRYR